ncbi:hypothetical protein BGX21_010874 [Mortierella sp. AD011]|nr:hypothetical protein BGX21_010874 [Mortierella sp. AD011]
MARFFVYIILSTKFWPAIHDTGFPIVKHKEYDPHDDILNPPQRDTHLRHRPAGPENQPNQTPPVQQKPMDSDNRPWLVPEGKPATRKQEKSNRDTGASLDDSIMVDDEGDATPSLLGEEETKLSIAVKDHKVSPMSYAQLLGATRRERNYAIALIVDEANLALNSTRAYLVTNKN